MLGGSMLSSILPKDIWMIISELDLNKLTEIRIRSNQPLIIYYGNPYYMAKTGLTETSQNAIYATPQMLKDIVFSACQHSIYAHNEELKQGYVTLDNGVRLGICGEIVWDNDKITTIKNFTSINIRIPHTIPNCSLNVIPYLYDTKLYNTLIISPPGAGKTTFLNDLSRQISVLSLAQNILIVDERKEISRELQEVENIDVYTNCNKKFGLINGIRTMSPDVILLDEIITKEDIQALDYAISSGVTIFATTHCSSIFDLERKPIFRSINELQVFERIVLLSKRLGPGTIEGVYNEHKKCIYFGEK